MDQVSERRSVERHSSSGTRRLTLVDLPAPFTLKPVKVDGIISYDIDNAYPSRMERLINSSVTAKAAAGMYARFLSGQGFADESLNTVIVGKDNFRSITALELLRKIAASIAKFNGVYVRAQFTGYNPSAFRIEPFRYCRLGDMDDQDFSAKIVVYNNWDRWKGPKLERGKYIAVDVWNPLKAVIDAQVAAAGSFGKWKGQMYYSFLDDEYIYPLSPIDVTKWDADTESQIAIFKNGELRRGFFLKYILHHTKFNTDDEADDFVKKMQGFMGGDHEKAMMVLEGSFGPDGQVISGENVKLEKIEQNINDKMFEGYESSTQNAIRKAFNAIPQILIDYEDSKLGTTSGEALRQAAFFYNSMTLESRMKIAQIFKELFKNFIDPALRGRDWTIQELDFNTGGVEEDPALAKKRESQALLKGSVGGVTALLELQKSVAAGTTDRTAGIAILEEIYGVDTATAEKMLGTPKEIPATPVQP